MTDRDGRLYRLLARWDAERVHERALALLAGLSRQPAAVALARHLYAPATRNRSVQAFGLNFAHPLGLAAGFDKDGRAHPMLAALGFSFIEIGTVTPLPQAGSPKPRLFRLPEDGALINRMGFPSAGAAAVAANLKRLAPQRPAGVPLFASLGKNKDTPLDRAAADYAAVLGRLHDLADGFVINISSPNTPDLRRLQTPALLGRLLATLMSEIRRSAGAAPPKPLLVKIAPDVTPGDLDVLLDGALAAGVSGIIATNTTTARDGLRAAARSQTGGLSGRPLQAISTALVRHIHHATAGKLPVIGVGGVMTADDLAAKLDAGAVLVQAYTGFVRSGPGFVRNALA